MKIKMEAVFIAVKEIVDSGQEEAFVKICCDEKHFVTANKSLIKHAKLALHRAELAKEQPPGRARARAAAYERETDTCRTDD